MDMIEVGGLHIAYERVGSGPPLLLLHGYVGDGPGTWRAQLDALSDEFTVVAWDAPGAGRSSDPPEEFGMAGYADCLAGFIKELAIDKPHVAGLSFGGALAIEFVHRHPAVPETVILASAYAGWAGSLGPQVAAERLRQALALADLSPDEFVRTLLPTMFSKAAPKAFVDAFAASMRAFHSVGFRAMARALAGDLRDAVPLVDVPTLLICGDGDVRAPVPVAEDLHSAIMGSTLVVLAGAGHVCNIDAVQEFNSAIRRFVSETQMGAEPA